MTVVIKSDIECNGSNRIVGSRQQITGRTDPDLCNMLQRADVKRLSKASLELTERHTAQASQVFDPNRIRIVRPHVFQRLIHFHVGTQFFVSMSHVPTKTGQAHHFAVNRTQGNLGGQEQLIAAAGSGANSTCSIIGIPVSKTRRPSAM